MKEGRKPEYPEKTPGDELQKMPHTKARRFKLQTRLEPEPQHWWQARKADVLPVRPRVTPGKHLRSLRVMSQTHASVSQGRIYSDNCTCCHTDIEVADPTFHLT